MPHNFKKQLLFLKGEKIQVSAFRDPWKHIIIIFRKNIHNLAQREKALEGIRKYQCS